MRVEVLLIIDVRDVAQRPIAALGRAMERRGWLRKSANIFRVDLETQASDTDIVSYVEQNVREAEYDACLHELQAVCILNSAEDLEAQLDLDLEFDLPTEWDPAKETGSGLIMI